MDILTLYHECTAILVNRCCTNRLSHINSSRQGGRAFFSLMLIAFFTLFSPAGYLLAHDNVHVVQPGETLSEIAQSYGITTETLHRLNGLGDADLVWVGQSLALPESVAVDATTDPTMTDTTPAFAADTEVYIVQPDDTLSAIAVARRTSLAQIVELNRISPTQRLYVGQSLDVPLIATSAVLDDSPEKTTNDLNDSPGVHVVQRGEQLGMLANQYGVSVRALAQANSLANASLITPGQRLVIPTPGTEAQAAGTMIDGNAFHIHESFPTTTEKWIDVDLSEQRVVAYEGTTAVNTFIISSGLPGTPTVTGTFRIWAKTPIQDMYGGSRTAGDYYYLPDVQWVQYFFEDYAFHGTYWHNNFGQPMSHGCINMRNEDAEWLFTWASPTVTHESWLVSSDTNAGTQVLVHE